MSRETGENRTQVAGWTRWLLSIVATAAIAFGPGVLMAQNTTTAESASTLLEKGIYAEETKGDLDSAIKLYQQAAQEAQKVRPVAAQAMYRLGMCYLKKGDKAAARNSFNELTASYSDQKQLAAKAQEQIAKIKEGMSDADTAKIVGNAVKSISTMADGDSRIPALLQSLRDLKESAVVSELTKQLDSDKNTVRRAAVYVIWKGEFFDASSAVPGLVKLCSHEEDLTRGMAALALGELKATSAFDELADMTANDKSGYARRAAAYALGQLGDSRGKGVLEKALKDKDPMVRNNAEAALTMLQASSSAPRVVRTTPTAFATDVDPSLDKITVTFDRPMMTDRWSFTGGGDTFPKRDGGISYDAAGTTCSMPVKLEPGKVYWVGINSPSHRNFKSADGTPVPRYVIVFATKSADGEPTLPENWPKDLVRQATMINLGPPQGNTIVVKTDLPKNVIPLSDAARRQAAGFIDELSRGYVADAYKRTTDQYRKHHKGLDKLAEVLDLSKAKPTRVLVSDEAACIIINPVTVNQSQAQGSLGLGMSRFDNGWLIRDVDNLPNPQAVDKFVSEFKASQKNAAYIMEHDAAKEALKAKLVNWVEKFFSENYRDITARKMISWGEPETDADGNLSIRYKYAATIWNKDKLVIDQRFTFTPEGKYVSAETIEKGPAGNGAATTAPATSQPSDADKKEAESLTVTAWRLWQKRDLGEAEGLFAQAVAKDPTNANAWNGLGWSQLNQGKKTAAKEAFTKAVEVDPQAAASWNGLGWIAKGEDDVDQAVVYWKKAVDAAPTATAALSGLAPVYMDRSQYDEAIKAYELWLKAEPENATAKEGLKKAQQAVSSIKAAVAAAQTWLKIIDAGKYQQSWDEMAKVAKSAVTKEQWSKDAALLKPFGELKARKLSSSAYATSLPGVADGHYVTIQYASAFVNKEQAVETVTVAKEADGTWKVAGYFVK